MQIDRNELNAAAQASVPAPTLTPPPPHAPVARIHELDGLRGLLALFVVSYHLYGPLAILHEVFAARATILTQGWYAVDVFFVMSGFVMMHVYGKSFGDGAGAGTYWQFMRARVARLYPVHVVAMCVMLLGMLPAIYSSPELYAWNGRFSLGAFAGSLLMLHGPWIDYRSWNYPAWSISAEWHAYLVFPFLVALVRRTRAALGMAVCAACVLVPFVLYLQDLAPDQYPTNGWPVLLRVLPLFVAGMLLYRVRTAAWARSGVAAAAIVLATLLVLSNERLAPLAVLLVPLLVLVAMGGNWLQGALRSAPLLWLGKISYSLYMTHALVETFCITLPARVAARFWHVQLGSQLAVSLGMWLAGIGIALCLGYLTWRWVEEPGRRWVMQKTAAWRTT